MQLARARNAAGSPTHIVALDAFTVYRGMDVGTAKPSASERQDVSHHLVDVLDPCQELSVAEFQTLARAAIDEIHLRGATPLLVGGSGLYWRAVVDGLEFPPTDPATRARLESRYAEAPDQAHAELMARDPAAAGNIAAQNVRRSIRALEVMELTGRRFSEYATAWDRYEARYGGLKVAYLEPPSELLRERIRQRARTMVDGGLVEEAAGLRSTTPLSRTAAQAIGYAEAFAVLDGDADADGLAERIATRTWKYARRQRSWFRADPRCAPCTSAEVHARWGRV